MEVLVGERIFFFFFIIWVLAKSTDVCIAWKCWIFAPARIFWFVSKHLCVSQQQKTFENERTQQDREGKGEEDEKRAEEWERGKDSDVGW